jgi:hypothetical protein
MKHATVWAMKAISVLGVVGVCALLAGCQGDVADSDRFQAQPSIAPTETTDQPATTTDPIEQARAVLGGVHSYDEVLAATDAALAAGGMPRDDENRSRLWSSILRTGKGLAAKGYANPDPMTVMTCLPGSMAARGVALLESVAYCSLEVAGIPESEW